MTGWDLRPQGISQVLSATGKTASHLETQAKDFGKHLQTALTTPSATPAEPARTSRPLPART
ncbi:DUF6507 family protein [Streptomyces griseofuscus]|uniref:DUF6507 family protein n=1 Tax=Streptomyces griseofuscus TaxID=146922 RepID=UPI003451C7B4